MNKFFTLGIILLSVLIACDKENINLREEPQPHEIVKKLLFIGGDTYHIADTAQTIRIGVDCNIDYNIGIIEEASHWITLKKDTLSKKEYVTRASISQNQNADWISLNISQNKTNDLRYGKIVINNTHYELSDTLSIIQSAKRNYYSDGSYIRILEATKGDVNLIIMGDGFTKKDLEIGGFYEQSMLDATNHFFATEPFKSYRDFFNVYMVVAESNEEGVGENNLSGAIDNKFGSAFGVGTEIVCDKEQIFEYAHKIKELPLNTPLTIIVVLNSTKYAGTTYLYANGNSIALCPMSNKPSPNDFEGIIRHEAGGHGFGFLADEYVYYQQVIPEQRKQEIKEWQALGFQMNLDFTNDSTAILWKAFIGLDKYQKVGIYAGGYEYMYGVWRSENNSCMNNNIPYFNAQSRWSIVNRIMNLSGINFTFQDFIKTDKPESPIIMKARSIKDTSFIPLGKPVWIR